jgi:hypothetical protein
MLRDSPRRGQVIAFQQGYRAGGTALPSQYETPQKEDSHEALRLLAELYYKAHPGGPLEDFRTILRRS